MPSRADRACERNAEILASVFAEHQRQLLAHARSHARIESDAEEALQRACVLFIERYQEHYAPLPWLYTTIKREAWGQARRAHRRYEIGLLPKRGRHGEELDPESILVDDSPGPAELTEASEHRSSRIEAIEELKPDERTALLMLGLGCSYREICRRRGWTNTKVNRCLAEGRAALRAAEAGVD